MGGTRTYRLEVEGELSSALGPSFPGMSMRRSNGKTMLVGPVRDQAELHGLLDRCLTLGLTLVSVNSSPTGTRPATVQRRPDLA
jgi:hypothetical protein